VPVGKTPDGLYVMHKWALEELMQRAQAAEDVAAKQAEQIAAVINLHTGLHRCIVDGVAADYLYCTTARALGVAS
jgi:hypothetical protein